MDLGVFSKCLWLTSNLGKKEFIVPGLFISFKYFVPALFTFKEN